MTPPTPVSEEDREAAANQTAVWGDIPSTRSAHRMRCGEQDNHPLVQAFARHRTAAVLAERKRWEGVVRAELSDVEEDIRWANDSDLDRLIKRRERIEAALQSIGDL